MDPKKWVDTIISGASLACDLILKLLELKLHKTLNKENNTDVNEILFYGANDQDKTKKTGLNNLLCIFYLILHANRCVDVCVPSLVSPTLAKCLITVQQRNRVKIRIIIHRSDDFTNLRLFLQNNIEIKIMKPAVELQHEFVLIDAAVNCDSVAVLGSLDYDTERVNCNQDATILTSDHTVIRNLKKEFDRIWNGDWEKAKQ